MLRSARSDEGRLGDWKTRLAARDRDVAEAQEQLADVTVELQESRAELERLRKGEPDELQRRLAEAEETAASLAERLRAAEAEIADLSDLEVDGDGDPDLGRRVEQLEVELATAASLQCPNPSAHRRRDAGDGSDDPAPDSAVPVDEEKVASGENGSDDLTLIKGIGNGMARVLKTMGISTYRDLAEISESEVDRLDALVGGARDRFERNDWVGSARSQHAAKYGERL